MCILRPHFWGAIYTRFPSSAIRRWCNNCRGCQSSRDHRKICWRRNRKISTCRHNEATTWLSGCSWCTSCNRWRELFRDGCCNLQIFGTRGGLYFLFVWGWLKPRLNWYRPFFIRHGYVEWGSCICAIRVGYGYVRMILYWYHLGLCTIQKPSYLGENF